MQLILEINEAIVPHRVKIDAPEDCADDKGADEGCFWTHNHLLHGTTAVGGHVCQRVDWCRTLATEDVECSGDAFQTEHVVAIGRDVNLVDDVFTGRV